MTYHVTTTTVKFPRRGAHVVAAVASTEEQRIQGLHGRAVPLGPNEGMLFVFPDQAPPLAMTMAKMKIPLDFIFVGYNQKIAHIAHRVPAGRQAPILGPAVPWVLEAPFGFARRHRLVVGDDVVISPP